METTRAYSECQTDEFGLNLKDFNIPDFMTM